jgi:hypothetical protein
VSSVSNLFLDKQISAACLTDRPAAGRRLPGSLAALRLRRLWESWRRVQREGRLDAGE